MDAADDSRNATPAQYGEEPRHSTKRESIISGPGERFELDLSERVHRLFSAALDRVRCVCHAHPKLCRVLEKRGLS